MNQTNIENTLKNFGLEDKQIKVYLACIKTEEELTPHKLSKLTGVARTTVYDILMELSLKGLVELEQSDGFTKQQTLVKAKNPTVLRKILQERRKELTHLEADILHILPELKTDFHKQKTNSDFAYYPGIEGAKKILTDYEHLKLDLPLYRWDKLLPMDAFGEDIMQTHIRQTLNLDQARKAETKILVPLNNWTKHVLTFQINENPDYLDGKTIRYIDNPLYDIYMRLEIIGNYIHMVCAEGDEIWGAKFKSQALSHTFKSFFQIQWQQAKPITKELVKTWGENEFINSGQ